MHASFYQYKFRHPIAFTLTTSHNLYRLELPNMHACHVYHLALASIKLGRRFGRCVVRFSRNITTTAFRLVFNTQYFVLNEYFMVFAFQESIF